MWVHCWEKSGEQNVGMPLRCCKQPSFSITPPLRGSRRDKGGVSAQNAAGSSAQSVPPAAVPYSNKPPLGAAVGQT